MRQTISIVAGNLIAPNSKTVSVLLGSLLQAFMLTPHRPVCDGQKYQECRQ